jgi:hypothetical protein
MLDQDSHKIVAFPAIRDLINGRRWIPSPDASRLLQEIVEAGRSEGVKLVSEAIRAGHEKGHQLVKDAIEAGQADTRRLLSVIHGERKA